MLHRLMSLILIAATGIVALTACGGNNAEPAAPLPTATPAPAQAAPLPSGNAAEGFRVFRIVAQESEVTYQVKEEFLGGAGQIDKLAGFFNPIGRTSNIQGELQLAISGSQVQLGDNFFEVDLRTLTTDDSRRDRRIREKYLESNKYPLARFTASQLQNFPPAAAEGEAVPFQLLGDMTIRDITQPVTFDVVATLKGSKLTGTATTRLFMKDFGFDPPSIANILKVSDGVTVTLTFAATAER